MYGKRPMPHSWHLRPDDRRLYESVEGEWDGMQRRERMYSDGQLPGRRVYGDELGDVHRERSMPHGGDLQHGYGRVLESYDCRWDLVLGREPLHADGQLPGRRVYGDEPGDVHRERPVSHGGLVRSRDGGVHEPGGAERDGMQRRERMHDWGPVHARDLRRSGGDLCGERSMPRHGDVQPGQWRMYESREGERDGLQRRERVHDWGPVHLWDLRRRGFDLRRQRSVPRGGDMQPSDRCMHESGGAEWDSVQRR